jgi:predicted AlkP superfamily phosphohydrolase/phosphomutase
MVPSGDCGYVRLNLKGREREGIVDPEDAERLLDEIASGLMTFRDPDGQPAVRNVRRGSSIVGDKQFLDRYPDLIVHWSDQLPPHLAGVGSPQFGEVPALGWGSGRTGEHRGGAWALIVPGTSRLKTPVKPLHIIDIASTVCSALGVNTDGLIGQALLEPYTRAIPA